MANVRRRHPVLRMGVVVVIGLLAWAAIAGWFRLVEAGRFETMFWTERPARQWLELGVWLLMPVVAAGAVILVTKAAVPLTGGALVAAIVSGLVTAERFTDGLTYDNSVTVVVPIFVFQLLAISAMGMIVPVALDWLRGITKTAR